MTTLWVFPRAWACSESKPHRAEAVACHSCNTPATNANLMTAGSWLSWMPVAGQHPRTMVLSFDVGGTIVHPLENAKQRNFPNGTCCYSSEMSNNIMAKQSCITHKWGIQPVIIPWEVIRLFLEWTEPGSADFEATWRHLHLSNTYTVLLFRIVAYISCILYCSYS